jgi:hypothetical protein
MTSPFQLMPLASHPAQRGNNGEKAALNSFVSVP